MGETHVRVCRTLLAVARKLAHKKLEEELSVKEGCVSKDGKHSIEFMECLADCGEGPVVMVGDQTFENIDEGKGKISPTYFDDKVGETKELPAMRKL